MNCIANQYQPYYFFSKFPEKVSPIFNLVKLFTPLIWGLTFMSVLLAVFYFTFSSWIYSKLGLREHISGEEEILLYPFRVRMMLTNISINNIDIGFSSAFAFLIWSVWGGFILHMLLSNYLAVLTQPNYEQPIKNIDDFLASDKNVFIYPYGSNFIEFYSQSKDSRVAEMGKRMYAAKNYEHYDQLLKEIHTKDKDVTIHSFLDYQYQIDFGFWYKSNSLP